MNWSVPGIVWASFQFVRQRMSERMKSLPHSEKNWLHIRRTHGVKTSGTYDNSTAYHDWLRVDVGTLY